MFRPFAFALSFALAAPAVAQMHPTLKADIAVSSDIVRIGDLVENSGAVSEIAIFRAPDLGQTGTVATARIVEALRPHRLAGVDTGGLTEVTVNRASRAISLKQIETSVIAAAAQQFGTDAKNFAVTFDRDARAIHVEATAAAELRLVRATFEPGGRFDVTFELPGSAAARRLALRYTGTAVETVAFASLNRALPRGEVIRAADVTMERRPKSSVGADAIENIEHVAGLAARRALRAGQPLRTSDLMKPELVRQNETVTIHYEAPGIVLNVRGKAVDSGAEGDLVNVLNVQSKRTVQGIVTGPGRVTVRSSTPRIVEGAAVARTASLPAPSAPQRTE